MISPLPDPFSLSHILLPFLCMVERSKSTTFSRNQRVPPARSSTKQRAHTPSGARGTPTASTARSNTKQRAPTPSGARGTPTASTARSNTKQRAATSSDTSTSKAPAAATACSNTKQRAATSSGTSKAAATTASLDTMSSPDATYPNASRRSGKFSGTKVSTPAARFTPRRSTSSSVGKNKSAATPTTSKVPLSTSAANGVNSKAATPTISSRTNNDGKETFNAPDGRRYTIEPTLGDGDCVFRGLNGNGSSAGATQVRRQIAKQLIQHEEHYRPLIEEAGERSFDQLVDEMMTTGTYAGHEALQVFADKTGDDVVVYVDGQSIDYIRRFSPSPNAPDSVCAERTGNERFLLYNNHDHYDILIPVAEEEEEEEEEDVHDEVVAEEDDDVDDEVAEAEEEEDVDDEVVTDKDEEGDDTFSAAENNDDVYDERVVEGDEDHDEDSEVEEFYNAYVGEEYDEEGRDDEQRGFSGSFESDGIPLPQEASRSRGSPVEKFIGAAISGIDQARNAVSRALNRDVIPENLATAFEGRRQGQLGGQRQGRHDSTLPRRGSPVGSRTRSRHKQNGNDY